MKYSPVMLCNWFLNAQNIHVVVCRIVQWHCMNVLRYKCEICTAHQEKRSGIFLLILGAHEIYLPAVYSCV